MPTLELVNFIARSLVSKPEAVRVAERSDERDRVVRLQVAPEDLGRVIGKEGRTARAFRTVVSVATAGHPQKAKLDIVD